MQPAALIELNRVARSFDNGAVVAVHDVSLSIFAGNCISIVGPSGSGKSTLIQLMCGMDAPTSGTVVWNGRAITDRRQWTAMRASEIGVIFQEFLLLPNLTALQNVQVAVSAGGINPAATRQKALAALERVGLAHRARHLPHALSGGERQRVAVARGLVNEPRLLLVDEPTGSLDSVSAALVSQLLFDLQSQQGHALVLVTHDEALARRCTQQIVVRDGRIVEASR
jgi:predicted ABC-type transport system involved in lysophospholipase L1 biosynthesis ATPase subunit